MSSQRGEHWQRYIVPSIEQYSEGRSFLQGFADGAKGNITVGALAQAWFWGGMKTLLSPAIPDLLNLANVERPHFYYVKGATELDRAKRMLEGRIGLAYCVNVGILAFFYVLAVRGGFRMGDLGIWLGVICMAVVAITGPVGYAKYRLIMEPILCLMAGRGINVESK